MTLKSALLGAVALVSVVSVGGTAIAADLPVKAIPSNPIAPTTIGTWTGAYIGAQVGYGWDWSGMNLSGTKDTVVTTLNSLGNAPQGFTGGGRLGYDAQVGNLVFGIVTDINGANFTGNGSTSNLNTLGSLASGVTTNWWGDVNGRLGITFLGNNILPYVTGGLAYGGTKATFNCSACGVTAAGAVTPLSNAITNTSVGWDLGAGVETKISQNWSVFVEGKFIDLGTIQVPLVSAGNVVATGSQHFQFGVVEGGINYRF